MFFVKPLVSVIIPTYRRTTPLKEALASVCTQVYPCVEIIVIDDNADLEWNEKIHRITNEAQNMLQVVFNVKGKDCGILGRVYAK